MGNVDSKIEPSEVLELLTQLVERSLVCYDEVTGRYWMLETVRHYSRERLLDTEEGPAVRAKHAANVLHLLRRFSRITDMNQAIGAMKAVESELDNIRAAAMHTVATGQIVETTAIVRSLGSYWIASGNIEEPISLLQMALEPHMDGALDRDQADALLEMCSLQSPSDETARTYAVRALEECERLGDQKQIAECHRLLGNIELSQGCLEAAEKQYEAALERAEGADLTGRILSGLAAIALKEEKWDEARRRLESVESDVPGIRIGTMVNLAFIDIRQGKLEQAEGRLIEFGEIVIASKAALGFPTFGHLAAEYFAALGRWELVPGLINFARRMWAEMNNPVSGLEMRSMEKLEARARGELGGEVDALAGESQRFDPVEFVQRTMQSITSF